MEIARDYAYLSRYCPVGDCNGRYVNWLYAEFRSLSLHIGIGEYVVENLHACTSACLSISVCACRVCRARVVCAACYVLCVLMQLVQRMQLMQLMQLMPLKQLMQLMQCDVLPPPNTR